MLSRASLLRFGQIALLLVFSLVVFPDELPVSSVLASPTRQEIPSPWADLRVEGDMTGSRIVVGGQSMPIPPGSHVGPARPSLDGARVAATVVPTGAETAHLAEIYLFDRRSGDLLARIPGHSTQWQESGQLGYERDGRPMIYDLSTGRSLSDPAVEVERQTVASLPAALAVEYPQTIRVAHHPENGCRNVPDWQVDVIPFEEYVKRSVPAEVPISWPMEALKAQAVAARTYAWHKIRVGPAYTPQAHGRVPYDVTDWANYQMMCDNFYAQSNQAVDETAGQYLSAQSDPTAAPIIAMYSAQNSHPTLDNANVDYLRAVPDRMGLGKERYGHGWGLSQWGARDRALADHTYRQILGHYYTKVHLQNAFDPAQPLGGLIGLEPNGFLPLGGIRWDALVPSAPLPAQLVLDTPGGVLSTVGTPPQIGAASVISTPFPLAGRSGVWRFPLIADENATVDASLWLADTLQEKVTLRMDRTPPAAPSFELPASAEIPMVTLNVTTHADDQIGVSNGQGRFGWIWQGEALSTTVNSGMVTAEVGADGGMVQLAQAGLHQAGTWYGPYTTALPHAATYRALFRLRIGGEVAHAVNQLLPERPLARLDVTDKGGQLRLGLRDIWVTDFPAGEGYTDISVDFHLFQPAEGIEFRVHWRGETELALDRVQVFRLFKGGAQTISWPLAIDGEMATVTAVAFDAAGNVSAPTSHTIRIVDEHPPTVEAIDWPQGWQTRLPITLTATLVDPGSGLDFDSGGFLLDGQRLPVSFSARENPQARQQVRAVLADLADGEYALHVEIADQLGNLRQSASHRLQLDRSAPRPMAHALREDGSPLTQVDGWLAGPAWVEILAEDGVSGVSALAYVLDGAPYVLYSEPFRVDGEGPHRVRYWAQDVAGNYSASHFFEFNLDNTPPSVALFVQTSDEESVTVAWQAQDSGSGVASVEIEIEDADGAWTLLSVDDSATSAVLPFVENEPIQVRARATDRVGHTGEWRVLAAQPMAERVYLPMMQK